MRVLRRGGLDSDEKEVAAHRPDRNYRGENGGDDGYPAQDWPACSRACCRDADWAHSALFPGYATRAA